MFFFCCCCFECARIQGALRLTTCARRHFYLDDFAKCSWQKPRSSDLQAEERVANGSSALISNFLFVIVILWRKKSRQANWPAHLFDYIWEFQFECESPCWLMLFRENELRGIRKYKTLSKIFKSQITVLYLRRTILCLARCACKSGSPTFF